MFINLTQLTRQERVEKRLDCYHLAPEKGEERREDGYQKKIHQWIMILSLMILNRSTKTDTYTNKIMLFKMDKLWSQTWCAKRLRPLKGEVYNNTWRKKNKMMGDQKVIIICFSSNTAADTFQSRSVKELSLSMNDQPQEIRTLGVLKKWVVNPSPFYFQE